MRKIRIAKPKIVLHRGGRLIVAGMIFLFGVAFYYSYTRILEWIRMAENPYAHVEEWYMVGQQYTMLFVAIVLLIVSISMFLHEAYR